MADKSIRFGLFADDQASAKFDRVGQAAEGAGRKMRDSGDSAKEYGKGLEKSIEASDTVDTRAMGFRDTLTGVQDSMKGTALIAKGDLFNGFLTLGMGVGDFASGLTNFVLPSLGRFRTGAAAAEGGAKKAGLASRAWAAGQRVLNLALSMNPIGLVIIAGLVLAGLFVLLWKRSDTFRRIVTGAWNGVRAAAGAVAQWFTGTLWPNIRAVYNKIGGGIGAVKTAIGRGVDGIKGFFSGLGSAISSPFTSAFSGIRAAWNSTLGGKGFSVPSWVPGIGGKGFTIPYLAQGGVVDRPTLAMIGEAGREAVVPLDRAGDFFGGAQELTVNFVLDGKVIQQALLRVKRGNGGLDLGLA